MFYRSEKKVSAFKQRILGSVCERSSGNDLCTVFVNNGAVVFEFEMLIPVKYMVFLLLKKSTQLSTA